MKDDKAPAATVAEDKLNQELEAAMAGESPAKPGINVPGINESLPGEEEPTAPAAPAAPSKPEPKPAEPAAPDEPAEPAEPQPLGKRLERQFDRMAGTPPETGLQAPATTSDLDNRQPSEPYKPLDYANLPKDEDGGISTDILREDRDKAVAAARAEGEARAADRVLGQTMDVLTQRNFLTDLELDKQAVFAEHPLLNPKSPEFKEDLTHALNRAYMVAVGYDAKTGRVTNPRVRYADFVDVQLGIAEAYAQERATDAADEAAKSVARQASRTAIRPSGGAAKPKPITSTTINEMTEEEWESGGRERANQAAMRALEQGA